MPHLPADSKSSERADFAPFGGDIFIVLKAAKCTNVGFAKSLPDLPEDVVRDQRPKVTAHQRVEHANRSRLAPPQDAANEDVRVDDGSNECPQHAGLASRLGRPRGRHDDRKPLHLDVAPG